MKIYNLVILFSGNGSNMENIIRSLDGKIFADSNGEEVKLKISKTFCNKKDAYGIKRCEKLNIPCEIIESKGKTREEFDKIMIEKILQESPKLCVLAGFMRILTKDFITSIVSINIHPSFLPYHKGAHGIQDSFKSGENGGVSVHLVSEELDGGEIIYQERLHRQKDDTLISYENKIHDLEYQIYPKAILKALELKDLNGIFI